MEDIEYLEEYEDLVLPALNSAAAEAATSSASYAKQLNQKKNDDLDDSSSSLDQDIFNCLFDDNSDDEDYNDQNSGSESALISKTQTHQTFGSSEDKFGEIGNTVIEKVEISRQDPPKKSNIIPKTVNKITSSTKPKGFMSKTSGTTVPLNPIKQETSPNKTKSVATVRPTVQNQLKTNPSKTTNIGQRPSSSSASATSAAKGQKPSTSASGNTYRTIRFPVVPPKQTSISTTSSPLSAKYLIGKNPTVGSSTTGLNKDISGRPATIVRPERIITKDPANDPLGLDDISEADSDNSSFSDISGETYNSITDSEEEEEEEESNDEFYSGEDEFYEEVDEVDDISSSSNIIELSNDSSGARSKLEDIRAPTPSPVISDDSDTTGSTSGLILSKKQTIRPYSHPSIIQSVLTKGEKPKLLELLQAFNLLEDSVESIKEDNIVIDITTSRENLVENTDNQQEQVTTTSSKEALLSPPSTTTIIIDPVDSTTVNNKSLTLNTPNNIEQTNNNSKKTNKKKKKKSLTNMDATTNDYSTDSDLSAVEELLEESYAEAMKRVVNNVPNTNHQSVGAEVVIGGEEEVTVVEENKQKLPKADVVIDYDDKIKQIDASKTAVAAESLLQEQINMTDKFEDEQLNEEPNKLANVTNEPAIIIEQSLETNVGEKQPRDNNNDVKEPKTTGSTECEDIIEIVESDKSTTNDSLSGRKKKRFRNLVTPDPNEKPSDETQQIDNNDFKGFDKETVVNVETEEKTQPTKDIAEKPAEVAKSSENHLPPESFKSPPSSHQSLKDKSRDAKSRSSRESSSSDSREKSSSKHSQNKKSSGETSRDRSRKDSSRENSKERSSDSSRDRPKHSSRDREHHSKHKDPRRSIDSKESSSKSRESSKSRDSKDSKERRDTSKSNSSKKDHSHHSSKDKKNEDAKSSTQIEKYSKEIRKSSTESKSSTKDYDNRKDSKEHRKSSLEKCDKKTSEMLLKTPQNEKETNKSSNSISHEAKQSKDLNKSSNASSASRESSKDRKSTNKNQEPTKSETSESKKLEKPKSTTEPNKSSDKAKIITSTATKNEKVQNSTEQQKTVSKITSENAYKDKIVKSTNDSNKTKDPAKNLAEKKISQNPTTTKSSSSAEQKPSKTVGGDSKVSSSTTPQKSIKSETPAKKDVTTVANKTFSDKKEFDKSDSSHNKTKVQTPVRQDSKESVGHTTSAKPSEGSSKKPSNAEIKDTTNLASENVQKLKTPAKNDGQVQTKSKTSDGKKTNTNTKELDIKKTSDTSIRSHTSKQEELKSNEKSIKNNKKMEHSKEEKPTSSKSKEKPIENKFIKDNQTKDSTINSPKSDNNKADSKVVKTADSNVQKILNKNETKQTAVCKTPVNSDKQKAVLEKNESKKAPKKDNDATPDKSKLNETNKSSTPVSTEGPGRPEIKKPLGNKDATKPAASVAEKKESAKSTTPSSKTQKPHTDKTPLNKQDVKEQKPPTTTPKNVPTKTKLNTSITECAIKVTAESSTTTTGTKDKPKENITSVKKLDSKTSSVSSPKTSKKVTSTVSKTKTEAIKNATNIQGGESKTIVVADIENDKEESKCVEANSNTITNLNNAVSDEVKPPKDATCKVNKENLADDKEEQTKLSQTNEKKTSLETPKAIADEFGTLEENLVSQRKPEVDNSSSNSSRTQRLMETVLKKSVVILIEPLKSLNFPYIVKSNESDMEIEPRRTRSCNETIKQDESITKEEDSKEKSSETSSSLDDNRNKNEHVASENVQMQQKTAAIEDTVKVSETRVLETTIAEKPETEEPIKTKQKPGTKTETQLTTDNSKTALIKEHHNITKENTNLKTITQKLKNQEKRPTSQTSEINITAAEVDKVQDQYSESTKIAEEKDSKAESNKSEIESKSIVAAEPIKTRQKSDLKTPSTTETANKRKSEILQHKSSTSIKSRQKTDSKTPGSGRKETSEPNAACDEKRRMQVKTKAELKAEATSTTRALAQEKSVADIENEKNNLEFVKSQQQEADLKTDGDTTHQTVVVKTICEEKSASEGKMENDLKTEKIECKEYDLKTDVKAELKKINTKDNKETTSIKSETKEPKLEQPTETNTADICNEKIEIKEDSLEQIKPHRKVDNKTESKKSKVDDKNRPKSATKRELSKSKIGDKESKELKSEQPITARQKTDLTKKSDIEKSDKKFECEESSSESFKTRKRTDLIKEAAKANEISGKKDKSDDKTERQEPIVIKQKSDLKTATTKKPEAGETKSNSVKISEDEEPLDKTKQTSDLNAEETTNTDIEQNKASDTCNAAENKPSAELAEVKLETTKDKIPPTEISNVENAARSDNKGAQKTQRKTLNCDDKKPSNQKETKEETIEQSVQSVKEVLKPEEPIQEPMKTRKRAIPKDEKADTGAAEDKQSSNKDLESNKTTSRLDVVKDENDKSKTELSQNESLDPDNKKTEKDDNETKKSKVETTKETDTLQEEIDEEQHLKPRITRSRAELAIESSGKEEKDVQKGSKTGTPEPVKKRLHKDTKGEGAKEKSQMLQADKLAEEEECFLTPSGKKRKTTGNIIKDVWKEDKDCSDKKSAVVCHKEQDGTTEDKSTLQKETEEPHLKPRLTRSRTGIEIEAQKESQDKTTLPKDSKVEDESRRAEKPVEIKEHILTPSKPSKAGNIRKDARKDEKSSDKSSDKKLDQVNDNKEKDGSSQEKLSRQEEAEVQDLTPRVTRSRTDPAIESSTKEEKESKGSTSEPVKTRQRKDAKVEDAKEKSKTLQADKPAEERACLLTSSKSRKSSNVKDARKGDGTDKQSVDVSDKEKDGTSEERNTLQEEADDQSLTPRVTRSRIDLAIESSMKEGKDEQKESKVDTFEPVKSKLNKVTKVEGTKEKNQTERIKTGNMAAAEPDHLLTPSKTRRSGNVKVIKKEMAGKSTACSDKKSEDVNDNNEKCNDGTTEKEEGEPVPNLRITRSRGDIVLEPSSSKEEKEQQKESEDETALRKDTKAEDAAKERNNTERTKADKPDKEKEHLLTPGKTRKAGNIKDVKKGGMMEEQSEHEHKRTTAENEKEPTDEKTSDNSDKKSKDVKDDKEKNEASAKKSPLQEETEEQYLTPRITRSHADFAIESATYTKNATQKNVDPISTQKETNQSSSSKEDLKTDETLVESVRIRRGRDDSQQQGATQSAENKPHTSPNDDETVSTADNKQTETTNTPQAPSDEVKNIEITEQSITLRLISEIDKIFQENSENELSGFESSSSCSDNTIRRTLRKRGTDSPFPENENAKKQFKEPPQKAITLSTPKSSKTENIVSKIVNASSKRILRSPAPETETQSPAKKPRLDTTKKSTRFRNLHDDGLEEEDVTAAPPARTSEETKEQPQVIEKRKPNESATTVRKTAHNENTKEIRDSSKTTVLLEKKVEEKIKDIKAPQISLDVLPEQSPTANEPTKQSTNKGESPKNRPDVENAAGSTVQTKTIKTKHKTTPTKSPASGSTSVLSFSDWLKNKNKPSESSTASEDSTDNLGRHSKTRTRTTTKSKEQDTEEQVPSRETSIIMQDSEKVTASPGEATENDSNMLENMNATQQLDNSLLRSSEHELQNDSKESNTKKANNKKSNVKRLQTPINKPKVRKSTTLKKTEIDLLIESMSKEMKDGGIKNLLNTEVHVKRQRLPNTKNLDLSASVPTRETRTLAASVVQLPKVQHADNEMEKALNVSENSAFKNKSPTRRRAQQNVAVSRKSTPLTHTDSSSRDSVNTPDITALPAKAEDPKARKSVNIKDLPRHTEVAAKTANTTDAVIKTRKSMPIMPSGTATSVKNANLSGRKSLAASKQQQKQQQTQVSETSLFKLPSTTTGPSHILNRIPTPSAENIKKLYTGEKNLSDSRAKIHQTEQNLLKKFKCRKLMVRLDRAIVQKFFNSTNNRAQQRLMGGKGTALLNTATRPAADALKIIQNNSETNLRIQSVVDASTLFNTTSSSTAIAGTQAAQTHVISSSASVSNSAQPCILPTVSGSAASLGVPLLNESFELKNEFMDENPMGCINEAILPDTPTLLARAQTITEAAHQALSNSATPTDIRLLTTDATENNFVPSFGVTPTVLDNRGTSMYTFLHPAKYNRNHSNVLLDYCCPNLDGPMPAIDPTRIHAQVQAPVIELPSFIVLTTKVVTRSDLENEDTIIPAIIRKKAEKIRKNMATHHKMAVSTVNTLPSTMPSPSSLAATPARAPLPPTINALTKQLPSTTTITPKIRPSLTQQPQMPPPKNSMLSVIPKGNMTQLSAAQQATLRSNLRRFDVLLKQLVQPYESLSFIERHRIIETIVASGKFLPKDLEQTLVLMEEYIKQTMLLKNELQAQSIAPAIMSTNSNYTAPQPAVGNLLPATQMPQLQPSPQILASNATPVAAGSYSNLRRGQSRGSGVTAESALAKQRQVPIYDTDRNIIGYQMQIVNPTSSTIPPASYTKPTMSSHTGGIMSTTPDSNVTAYKINRRPLKRPAQDSPRVFYTTPPLKTSTPKAITNSNIYTGQHAKSGNTTAQKAQGTIVTTVRSAGSSSNTSSETITTTTTATVKRVTRSTATGSKIIIVSKSNQSSEETILPDANSNSDQPTEIKHENDVEDFLG